MHKLTTGFLLLFLGCLAWSAMPAAAPPDDGDDPDLPSGIVITDRADYLARRDAFVALLHGYDPNKPFDPTSRSKANAFLDQQIAVARKAMAPDALLAVPSWTELGPNPIPNGQTQSSSNPVSGRIAAIEVDPSNPNTVYVGAAQGGVYRSTDGGTTWTPIFDGAQSLAIGALTLDPATGSLWVGTGEANGSLDSFAGVGLYRIDSPSTTATLVGPINPTRNYNDNNNVAQSTGFFTGSSISRILIAPGNVLFVSSTLGFMGIGGNCPDNCFFPKLAMPGLTRLANVNAASAASITGTRMPVGISAPDCYDNPCTGFRDMPDIRLDPRDATGNTLIAWRTGPASSGEGGIFRSTNAMSASPAFTQTFITTIDYARGGLVGFDRGDGTTTFYAATGESGAGTICGGSSGALRRSTDGGVTWGARLPGGGGFCAGQCFYNIAMDIVKGATSATDKILLGGNIRTTSCAKLEGTSTDGAATTFANTDTGLHADSHVIKIAPSNTSIVYRGDDGGVWKSTDGGATWASLNNTTMRATQFQSIAVHPTDANFSIGGTQDNGTEKLTTGPAWTNSDFGDGGYALIDQNATNTTSVTMYHTYYNQANAIIGFARSTNAGASWPNFLGCGGTGNGIICGVTAVNFYAPMALGPGNPNTVYFGSDRLLRSIDQGTTNVTVSQAPLVSGTAVSSIAISPQDDNYRIVGLNNGALFFTTTGSSTLTSLDPTGAGSVIPDFYVARMSFDPTNKNTVYIALGGYTGGTTAAQSHVWKVTNLSTTPVLTAVNSGLPDVPVNGLAVDPGATSNIYAGTDIGVFLSTNSGTSWSSYGTGLPRVAVFDIAVQNVKKVLRIATHGRGMWEILLNSANLCGTSTTTGAGQTFPQVTLTCNTAVNDTSGGPISFTSSVDGGFGLSTSTSGTTTFSGPVGFGAPLTSLAISAGTLNLGSGIKVGGNLSLNATSDISQSSLFSANTLSGSSANNAVLTNAGNSFASLSSFSAKSLSLNNSTALTINGPVTATGHPGSLAITTAGALTVNASAVLAGSTINLTGVNGIALTSNVTADTSLNLAATNGSISQASGTLTSSAACNVDAGAGTITFAGNASCGTPAFTAATTSVGMGGALNVGAGSGVSVIGTVTGNYSQIGDLTLKAFATSSHKLAVSGSAALGGTLNVNFASVPSIGQTLTVLTAASVSGTFATINITGLPSDRLAVISYSASSVVLKIRSNVTCFVKFDAAGAHNGLSWLDAYTDLQSALSNAGCDRIWVARGVYKPTATADRSIAFNLTAHLLGVYGGFAGNETLLGQRDIAANLTVLSGDIDNNDDSGTNGVDADFSNIIGNNSYHVVVIDGTTVAGPVGDDTVLDGFTITGGKADGALSIGGGVFCNGSPGACSPRLSNLVFSGNLAVFGGGALYNSGSGGNSSPSISDSTFSGNAAANGGAIYDDGSEGGTSNPSIANATFSDNSATSCGGAIYDDATGAGTSSPTIRSATFSGNSADSANGDGSAICDFTATGINATALTNAIVWGNTSPEISTYSGGMTLNHVVLQENACPNNATCSTTPIGADPHLGPLQDNGGSTPTHMIGAGSSASNAGLDSACVGAPVSALDQRGIVRPLGAHCDIGAVEATNLSLNVTDGGAFGFYGKALQYVVTLQNLSATDTISAVHVSGLGTAALDTSNTLWFCTVGNCTTTQTQGPLSDVATLVPNGTLTWLVNVPVIPDSTAPTATMTIHSNGVGAASDTDTLAIFRGTFDGP